MRKNQELRTPQQTSDLVSSDQPKSWHLRLIWIVSCFSKETHTRLHMYVDMWEHCVCICMCMHTCVHHCILLRLLWWAGIFLIGSTFENNITDVNIQGQAGFRRPCKGIHDDISSSRIRVIWECRIYNMSISWHMWKFRGEFSESQALRLRSIPLVHPW